MSGTKQDNTALIGIIRGTENTDLRRDLMARLYQNNIGLIRQTARRFAFGGVEFDDLLQTGFIALTDAVESFDADKGSFASWLILHLTGAFTRLHESESAVQIPSYRREQIRQYQKIGGAAVPDAEACALMGVDVWTLAEIKQATAALSVVSLSSPVSADDGDGLALGDMIGDDGAAADSVIDGIEAEEMSEAVQSALDGLPAEERETVRLVYLQGHTHAETAKRMHTTTERVRVCRDRAFKTLRKDRRLKSFVYGDALHGSGLHSFLISGTSSTEREALHLMGCWH